MKEKVKSPLALDGRTDADARGQRQTDCRRTRTDDPLRLMSSQVSHLFAPFRLSLSLSLSLSNGSLKRLLLLIRGPEVRLRRFSFPPAEKSEGLLTPQMYPVYQNTFR